jgi:hypothetical protein
VTRPASSFIIASRREAHGGVGDVVAEVAAVQRLARTVDDEVDLRDAAVAEHDRRALALVARAVEDDQCVACQEPALRGGHAADRRRALLLLAVDQHLDVDRGVGGGLLEAIERGEEHGDRRLVVGGRAAEHAQLGIERRGEQRVAGDDVPAASRVALLDHRLPRARLRPLAIDDRLAVEVHVEQDGPGAARAATRRKGRLVAVVSRRVKPRARNALEERDVGDDIGRVDRVVG